MQSPKDKFNGLAEDYAKNGQLKITHTTTDGWHFSFTRADGLHLWRVVSRRIGSGIQTAWLVDGRFTNHRMYARDSVIDALSAAMQRHDGNTAEGS